MNPLFYRGEESFRIGVIAKRRTEVREQVDISGRENEAGAQLERIFAQLVLLMTSGAGAISGPCVFRFQKMQDIRLFQSGGFVGQAIFIDEQRKIDAGVFTKHAGVIAIAESDSREVHALLPELRLVFAQLRDMLAAENSTIVAQKHNGGGLIFPEGAEAHGISVGIGQREIRQSVAERVRHLIQSI
jgi:hypothetical protein